MHRQDRFSAWRDRFFDAIRIDVVCERIDVDENRPGPNQRYRPGGSDKCVGSCNDLIARSYSNREQRKM
jgi:hypothetical protein